MKKKGVDSMKLPEEKEFNYIGKVKAKERPRLGKYGVYTPKGTNSSEKDIIRQFKQQFKDFKVSESAVGVRITFVFEAPKKPTRFYPCKSDLDNLIKTVLDAFNGVIWKDDVQVVQLLAQKHYGSFEGFQIVFCEID